MKPAFWLAWRELANRRAAFIAGIGMVAVAVTFCAAVELVSRAREAAVAAEIDHIGPALRLIPAGKTAGDLARFDLGSAAFTMQDARKLRSELSTWIRAVEGRLLLKVPVEGRTIAIIGVDPNLVISPLDALGRLGDSEAALGADLARRLRKKVGDEMVINSARFRVAAVLPETAGADDLALFLPLRPLQRLLDLPDGINEMRVFPAPAAPIERIASSVAANHPELNVINTYRGDTAEHGMSRSLLEHRRVLYVITASVIAFCILIWSYLNAGERRLEMATVVAIGGTGMTVLSMLVIRAAIVGFLGGLVGYAGGAFIALVQDFQPSVGVVLSWNLVCLMSGGAVVLSILGGLPASLLSAYREHVTVLQEW